jgi:hypothetical protein
MSVWTYAVSDVSVLIAGVFEAEGLAADGFISITKDIPQYSTRRSTDGVIARTKRKDTGYTVKLTVVQTSETNNLLMKMLALDYVTDSAKFPLFVKDRSGTSVFAAATCWIVSEPETSFSNELEMREWTLQCTQAVHFVGGAEQGSTLDQLTNLLAASAPVLAGLL